MKEAAGGQLWSPLGCDHSRDWTLQKSSDPFCWVSELVKMHDLLSSGKEHLEHDRCSPVGLPQPDLLHKGLCSSPSRKTPGQSADTPGLKPAPLRMEDVRGGGQDRLKKDQAGTHKFTHKCLCLRAHVCSEDSRFPWGLWAHAEGPTRDTNAPKSDCFPKGLQGRKAEQWRTLGACPVGVVAAVVAVAERRGIKERLGPWQPPLCPHQGL